MTEETTWTCHQCGKTYTDKWWKEPDWLRLRVEMLHIPLGQVHGTVMLRLFCSAKCMYDFTKGDEWTLVNWST